MRDDIIKDHKIFIDTCSLMHENCLAYFHSIESKLKESDNGIVIAKGVYAEIEKHSNSVNNDLKDKANQALEIINYLKKNNIGKIFGDKDDGFVDNLFQSLFIRFRQKYNLCLITQDVDLMKDIHDLTKSRSVKTSNKILVYKFSPISSKNNRLIKKFYPYKKDHQLVKNSLLNNEITPFKASRKVVDIAKFKNIVRTFIPSSGDIVISNKGISIMLKENIASGAEGDIYTFEVTEREASSDKYLCKIYKKNKMSNAIIEKLKIMISKKIDIEGVCWPISLLYNSHKEVVGYVMEKAFGYELQRSLFIEPLRKKKLGTDWKRKDLIRLSLNILTTVDLLHKHNIIIGDINPGNIMIDKNANAFFIDTDSYQIEGYPCPVGSPSFTHPDILRKKFVSFLRKKEHEHFAIATLLFMILVPGKSPFAFQGGSSPAANIKKRNFVYPFSSKEITHYSRDIKKNTRWWYIWNNFPHRLKEAFFNSFVNSKVISIHGENGWLKILDAYQYNIKKGWVSDEIFPTTLKEISEEQKQRFNKGE